MQSSWVIRNAWLFALRTATLHLWLWSPAFAVGRPGRFTVSFWGSYSGATDRNLPIFSFSWPIGRKRSICWLKIGHTGFKCQQSDLNVLWVSGSLWDADLLHLLLCLHWVYLESIGYTVPIESCRGKCLFSFCKSVFIHTQGAHLHTVAFTLCGYTHTCTCTDTHT